ncbi:MAG: transporter substrate-binding domain-containing protein [Alphaproteobacteria bacterium]
MKNIVITVAIALVASFVGVKVFAPTGSNSAAAKETAYERVMRTGVLRCGYNYWDPGVVKNADGSLGGYAVDVAREIAKVGELKLEWVGPIEWGNMVAELASNKVDAFCAGTWQAGLKAKHVIFSEPFSYEAVEAFVRVGDNRFVGNLAALNSPEVTLVVVDNDNSAFIAKDTFPKAKVVALPVGMSDADMLQYVITGKADATFVSLGLARSFMAANPNAIQPAAKGQYLRLFGNTMVVNGGEFQLNHFMETSLAELENSGVINRLIDAYADKHIFLKKVAVAR